MADIKPLFIVVLSIILIGALLNIVVSPFVDVGTPSNESMIGDFAEFVDDGFNVSVDIPFIGGFIEWILGDDVLTFNISPASVFSFGIDGIGDFYVSQLNLLSHLPDEFTIPLIVIAFLSFGFTIITIIRGN